MTTEDKTEEMLALQKDNLHLKQSINALRDQLEKMKIARDEAVQNTLRSVQGEITQLKATIAAMRDELEKACYEKDCIMQQHIADTSDKTKQLTDAIAAMRNELESREITYQQEIQMISKNHYGEVGELQKTIKELRDNLEDLNPGSNKGRTE